MMQVYKAWKSQLNACRNECPQGAKTEIFVDNTPDELNLSTLFEIEEQLDTPALNCQIETEIETENVSRPSDVSDTGQLVHLEAHTITDCRQTKQLKEMSTFFPLTQTIPTHSTFEESEGDGVSLLEQAEVETQGRFSARSSTCLVGLHSCGDLGGVALRLFLREPQLNTMCVVGCCYHHITERDEAAG